MYVTADACFIYANSMNEARIKFFKVYETTNTETYRTQLVLAAIMGHTLIQKEVFKFVRFDPI